MFLSATAILLRTAGVLLFLLVLCIPGWWAAARIDAKKRLDPFFRLLLGIGLALLGYLGCVNLLGKLFQNSVIAVCLYLLLNLVGCVYLFRSRGDLGFAELRASWKSWCPLLLLAIVMGLPQWDLAVSTNYWDEARASTVHVTGANQFAEGVYPPRYNAFPDVPIKYHYGFILLSGTVRWLTDLNALICIDVASTALWLFIFLFLICWLVDLGFARSTAVWGGSAVLLGGGLSWAYVTKLATFSNFARDVGSAQLLHAYDPDLGWFKNLVEITSKQNYHLQNADGTYSSLPLEITNYFQQHAAPVGIALTLLAIYLFCTWQRRERFSPILLAASAFSFSLIFLGHAVFGGVACISAGVVLLGTWLYRRTRIHFLNGLLFGLGTTFLAFIQGGMLARGPLYEASGRLVLRNELGWAAGGLSGFVHWNIAGFGLPLLLAIVAWLLWLWKRDHPTERRTVFFFLTIYCAFAYVFPQIAYYAYGPDAVEEFTEVAKFFFCVQFAVGVLSVFCVDHLLRRVHWVAVVPLILVSAITGLTGCYAMSISDGKWRGFYLSPYVRVPHAQAMGEAFARHKTSNRDIYFDAAFDERRHAYLSELLLFGGSGFTLTPCRYEMTGAFPLAHELVAQRLVQSSRMARLLPNAPEESGTSFYYALPFDMVHAPLLVRTRFRKLVAEEYFVKVHEEGPRALYQIAGSTTDLDTNLEEYWEPKLITQARTDWDGDGKSELVFYDLQNRTILIGDELVALPEQLASGELTQLFVGSFRDDARVDLLLARTADATYVRGERVAEMTETSEYFWNYQDSHNRQWQDEFHHWDWRWARPLVARIKSGDPDRYLMHRSSDGKWFLPRYRQIEGPTMEASQLPIPFAARHLPGSEGDLGLWSLRSGMIKLRSLSDGREQSFQWGGKHGDVLMPGDFDGDGVDEIAVWQPELETWWIRASDGSFAKYNFGPAESIPVPADYDHDGALDFAYWQRSKRTISVSFDRGRTIARIIPVPPHAIPAYVNMY